jgi:hypothetical protein
MKKEDIKRYLQDYSIYNRRKSTINHAFCSALSVADSYNEKKIREALRQLGEDPDGDLNCIYCGLPAETWDHIMATVKDGKYSGFGHQIGNLVPCCKDCNSKKGNRDWRKFLTLKRPSEIKEPIITRRIENYIENNTYKYEELLDNEIEIEIQKLNQIKESVFLLLKEGDAQAKLIRDKFRDKECMSSTL